MKNIELNFKTQQFYLSNYFLIFTRYREMTLNKNNNIIIQTLSLFLKVN